MDGQCHVLIPLFAREHFDMDKLKLALENTPFVSAIEHLAHKTARRALENGQMAAACLLKKDQATL